MILKGRTVVGEGLAVLDNCTDSIENSELNPAQQEAVHATEGAVLVLAGAGTGKTRVLTARLAHIISSGLAYPGEVLGVTFTNKAANEMKHRIAQQLGRPVEGLWLGTFHSIAVRLLRRHAEAADLDPNFAILDTDDQQRLIKQIIKAENIDEKKNPPRLVLSIIGRWKDRALLPHQVTAAQAGSYQHLVRIYKIYQERLRTLNAVDFGDILLYGLNLLRNSAEILHQYQQQFKYILVDEYQDTNIVQYLWLRLLAQGHGNICCVGDDDQSIYRWRGAEVGNILKFEQDFPNAKVIRLEQNYRSTAHILGAASGLISNNQGRLGKELWTEFDGGEKVTVRGTWDSIEEARFIGDEIGRCQMQGQPLSNFAILVRAGFQTREFEDRLLTLAIPYRVIGGPRFYERAEIRDALAYLRLVVQPHDGMAFERIINTPRRGIGQATMQAIHLLAREREMSLPSAAIQMLEEEQIRGKAKVAMTEFFDGIGRWRQMLATKQHKEVAQIILDESGYINMWRQDKSADAPGRIENLKEFITAMGEFDSLSEFLEHVSLVMENSGQADGRFVTIMTLHAAKGLEFDTVFLAGWEETLFPHQRSLDEEGLQGLEEERRLAYVGITRAQKRAVITYSLSRKMYKGWQPAAPSRFIAELPKEHVVAIHASGQTVGKPRSTYYDRGVNFNSYGQRVYERHDADFRGKTIDAVAEEQESTSGRYLAGDCVSHESFGKGYVVGVQGEKLAVNFEKAGLKKVMARFCERED